MKHNGFPDNIEKINLRRALNFFVKVGKNFLSQRTQSYFVKVKSVKIFITTEHTEKSGG